MVKLDNANTNSVVIGVDAVLGCYVNGDHVEAGNQVGGSANNIGRTCIEGRDIHRNSCGSWRNDNRLSVEDIVAGNVQLAQAGVIAEQHVDRYGVVGRGAVGGDDVNGHGVDAASQAGCSADANGCVEVLGDGRNCNRRSTRGNGDAVSAGNGLSVDREDREVLVAAECGDVDGDGVGAGG